jgi:hypothetical protein
MTWLNFLQKYSKKNNMKLGDAMKPASKEWKKQKKTMKVGGVHCKGNPENILKNPAKTIFPNCPRKTRKHLKGNKGEKKRKGGEGEYASGVGPTNTSSDMDPMDTSDTSDMAPPSGMDPTNTSSDMAPLSIEGGKKDKKGKKEKK